MSRPSLFQSPLFALAWVLIGAVIALAAGLDVALNDNHHEDLLIYTAGAKVALARQSPYETTRIAEKVAKQYPDKDTLIANCGFFLAPQALPTFAPFAPLDWRIAKTLWCVLTVAWAALGGWRLLQEFGTTSVPLWLNGLAAFALLVNPMSLFVMVVGQTALFTTACVPIGEWVYRNGHRRIGCLVWALAFLKPHIALPLLPLAFVLGGWKRTLEILVWVAVLNLAGCAMAGRGPGMLIEYVDYLGVGPKAVEFNRIDKNVHISSWNRLLIAAAGPTIELGAAGILAGNFVWFSLAAIRCRIDRMWPSRDWALAVAAVAAPLCCQLLPYELPILVLTLPWIVGCFVAKRWIVGTFAVLFAAMALMLGGEGSLPYEIGRSTGEGLAFNLFESHQSLFVAALAAVVLIAGPKR